MTTVKATFICPSCNAGLNTEDQKRPTKCPGCGYKFGQVRTTAFRLPKTLFHQYRDITKARIEAIPPMPAASDEAEVNAPDAHARYMAEKKAEIETATLTELIDFIFDIPDDYIKDTVDSFEYLVEHLVCMKPSMQRYVTAKINRMYKIAANVAEGSVLGVYYGVKQTEPIPSTSPGSVTGASGVSTTSGGSGGSNSGQ